MNETNRSKNNDNINQHIIILVYRYKNDFKKWPIN